MARVPLVKVDDMTAEQRAQYDRFPSNLTRALLLTEQRLAGAPPNLANALRTSGLDAKLREGVILRVAALSHSAYERMQHIDQAQKAGWTVEAIEAIEMGVTGVAASLPTEFVALIEFVDACVAAPEVSGAVFDAARKLLTDRDLATVILLIGHYMMVARFTGVLQIELDEHADKWTSEH